MNRDTEFTIEDILDGAPLSEVVQEYSAIVSKPDTSETLKSLRFIRIPPNFHESNEGDLLFEIIGSEDYSEGADYIAVSYCWNSFTSKDEKNRTVSILDRGVTRKPRCSAQVLLRAARFAARTSITLVWIDQECIDQMDHDDLQKHIQCMHHIYRDAKTCIGLLNFELFSTRQLMCLAQFFTIDEESFEVWIKINSRLEDIEFLARLLKSIYKDSWFSRTWVFQERHSAGENMCLLFNVSPKLEDKIKETDVEQHVDVGNPHISLGDLMHNPAQWQHMARNFSTNTPRLQAALENLHIAAHRMNALIQGTTIDEIIDFDFAVEYHQRDYPLDGYYAKGLFQSIEACDNQIVSDRVAIFSNVADFPYRLDTLGLSSYSMSLLMLLLVNDRLPQILVKADESTSISKSLLVAVPAVSDLTLWSNEIRSVLYGEDEERRKNHPIYDDFYAVLEALARVYPEIWNEGADTGEDLIKLLEAGSNNNENGPLHCMVVIPVSATIQDIIDGIIRVSSEKRTNLTHSHGQQILRYAIKTGQAPQGAEFVAFYREFCWRAEFVEKFFGTEDTDNEDSGRGRGWVDSEDTESEYEYSEYTDSEDGDIEDGDNEDAT